MSAASSSRGRGERTEDRQYRDGGNDDRDKRMDDGYIRRAFERSTSSFQGSASSDIKTSPGANHSDNRSSQRNGERGIKIQGITTRDGDDERYADRSNQPHRKRDHSRERDRKEKRQERRRGNFSDDGDADGSRDSHLRREEGRQHQESHRDRRNLNGKTRDGNDSYERSRSSQVVSTHDRSPRSESPRQRNPDRRSRSPPGPPINPQERKPQSLSIRGVAVSPKDNTAAGLHSKPTDGSRGQGSRRDESSSVRPTKERDSQAEHPSDKKSSNYAEDSRRSYYRSEPQYGREGSQRNQDRYEGSSYRPLKDLPVRAPAAYDSGRPTQGYDHWQPSQRRDFSDRQRYDRPSDAGWRRERRPSPDASRQSRASPVRRGSKDRETAEDAGRRDVRGRTSKSPLDAKFAAEQESASPPRKLRRVIANDRPATVEDGSHSAANYSRERLGQDEPEEGEVELSAQEGTAVSSKASESLPALGVAHSPVKVSLPSPPESPPMDLPPPPPEEALIPAPAASVRPSAAERRKAVRAALKPLKERVFLGCSETSHYQKVDESKGGLLGMGTFGEVSRARHIQTQQEVALKKIKIQANESQNGMPITAIREIKLLKRLSHPNVCPVVDMVYEPPTFPGPGNSGTVYMVLPYMDHDLNGLLERLDREDKPFTPAQIKLYVKQLFEGTLYLHQNRILHRDIKAANILISNDGSLRIADFGLARPYRDPGDANGTPAWKVDDKGQPCWKGGEVNYTGMVVTRWYRPPELLAGERKYGPPVDMWGLGCILAEMIMRRPFFKGSSEIDQMDQIANICGSPDDKTYPGWTSLPGVKNVDNSGQVKSDRNEKGRHNFGSRPCGLRQYFMGRCRSELIDLIEKLLVLDPKKRLTAEGALAHRWFDVEPLPADPASLPKYPDSKEANKSHRGGHQPPGMQASMPQRQGMPPGNAMYGGPPPPIQQPMGMGMQGGVVQGNYGGGGSYLSSRPGMPNNNPYGGPGAPNGTMGGHHGGPNGGGWSTGGRGGYRGGAGGGVPPPPGQYQHRRA